MSYIKKINTFNKNCVVCKDKYETLFSQSKFCSIECKRENDKLYQRERRRVKSKMSKIKVVPIDTEYDKICRIKLDIIERMVKEK
jgi:predicted nucleic acid-binding Zn ribbon protein